MGGTFGFAPFFGLSSFRKSYIALGTLPFGFAVIQQYQRFLKPDQHPA